MIIEYERTEGDSRTLSIKFDAGGRFSGAEVSSRPCGDSRGSHLPSRGRRLSVGGECRSSCADPLRSFAVLIATLQLVHSNIDIEDLVDAYVPSQDVRSLVQEVRARIVR